MQTASLSAFLKLFTFGNGKDFFPLSPLLSAGNKKLPSTTAIFNMGAATDCPSRALGLCQAFNKGKCVCYALKAESPMYPEVLPYRHRQEKFWKEISAKDFAAQFIAINALKTLPFTALRFNEACDFWSQDCLNKAEAIACILARYGIVTYCYTARADLDFSEVRHLIVSGSGFMKDGITNCFKMITNKSHRPKGFGICPQDCTICSRCLVRGKKTVIMKH